MALDTMYAGKINSPATELDGAINDSVTTINVVDGSVLPDAPNIAVIGTGEDAETILYGAKNANELSSVTRGFQGTAKAWDSGTSIARLFTAYDYDTLRANIDDLDTNKLADITGESVGDLNDVDLTDIADTKILKYNSATGKFECEDDEGESNTASNIGSQTEIFKQKDGVDLEFRTLRAASSKITVTNIQTGTTKWSQTDATNSFFYIDSSTKWAGMYWKATDTYALGIAEFALRRVGNGCSATAYIYAYNASTNRPTGDVLGTSDTVDCTGISTATEGELIAFTFSSPVSLTSGSDYCIYLVSNDSNSSNYVNLRRSVSDIKSDSCLIYTLNSGTGWTKDCDEDLTVVLKTANTTLDYVNFDVDPSEIDLLDLGDTPAAYDDGKFLKSGASAFTLEDISIEDLSEISLTGVATGDILYYNGTNWVNLGIGAIGQVLTVSAGGIPEWATP